MTDEEARTAEFSLDFLTPGKTYEAVIYADAPDAHYKTNPKAYEISRRTATADDSLSVRMAPGGGFAISLRAL